MKTRRARHILILLVAMLVMTSLACSVFTPKASPPARCNAKDGQWVSEGGVGFIVSDCVVSDLALYLVSGDSPRVSIHRAFAPSATIENNRFSSHSAQGEGTLTINGSFTSPTMAQGTWALTKGAQIGGTTITQDTSRKWIASFKQALTPTSIAANRTPSPTPLPSLTAWGQSSPTSVAAVPPTSVPTTTPRSTATKAPTPTPRPTTTVIDAQVKKLFSPGPDPVAVAVAGDSLWIADGQQHKVYQLDRAGTVQSSFVLKPQGDIRGLAWDGEALRVLLSDYQKESRIVRLSQVGAVLSSLSLPLYAKSLAWNPKGATFWVINGEGDYLLEFTAEGKLLQILHAPVFGDSEALACAPDGLWGLSGFGTWVRFGFDGRYLSSNEFNVETFASTLSLTWDEQGYLWLSVNSSREIFQYSVRQAEADRELPPEMQGGLSERTSGELPLPGATLQSAKSSDEAVILITNNLSGPLNLSVDSENSRDVHQSVSVAPGETWTVTVPQGTYKLYASANLPEPVAFSGSVLLVRGYEHTWSIADPKASDQ